MNTQMLWLFIKRINRRFNFSLILSLLMFSPPIAIAGYLPPPNQQPPSDYSRSGGTRGCPEEPISLTVLAPKTYVGYTASKHPTFAWFLYSDHETDFRLFEFDTNGQRKQIGKPIKLPTSKGINKYSLPENHPELEIGKKYLWQVAISCPDGALVQRAEFMVVEMSSVLKSKLPTTVNSSQKANIYADESLWYEALKEALKLAPDGKLGEVGSTLVQSLAQSENQGNTPHTQQEIQQIIENLKAIANQSK
ncbi:DUF928 domain-containing protein [Nostoc sp. UHCC 0702]|nr:DUF928 domain-containing protein [Nostoc sp. UHCC 0702]